MLKGFQNEAKMDAGAAVGSQLLDFGSQNLQNITKMASKISEISRLRRGCVFGVAFGTKTGGRDTARPSILGAIFDQKSQKWHPKRHAKFDVEKVSKNNGKRLPKLCKN